MNLRDELPSEVQISVTALDIERGQAGNPYRCPVALAVNRAFGVDSTRVGSLITVADSGAYLEIARYSYDGRARGSIRAFDLYESVEPFTFTARIARTWHTLV